jgi:uncharacterized protein (DUF885 family)
MQGITLRRHALPLLGALLLAAPALASQQAGRQSQAPRTPTQARPQDPTQTAQQTRLMTRMQETLQRTTQLQERAHQLAEAARRQVQERAQVTERERLMLRTCEGFEGQAQQLRQLATRAQEMMQHRDFAGDREMQRDMDRLRTRLHEMADGLEESLQLMERIRTRTQTQTQIPPE